MIAILDYGVGNLNSIRNMFSRIGVDSIITGNHEQIESCDKLLLPGIGRFDHCMKMFRECNMDKILIKAANIDKKPILGICAGAQMLTKKSEEGNLAGMSFVDARTVRFQSGRESNLKIPHMGWSSIEIVNPSELLANLPDDPRFYFVHSYHFEFEDSSQVLARCNYGYDFACAFQKGNVMGVQFHPEKSHQFGMKVLKNFAEIH